MVKKIIGTPTENNEFMIERIKSVHLDEQFRYKNRYFIDHIYEDIKTGDIVLDCGKCSRHFFQKIRDKASLLETLDVFDFGPYPDILCDLCQPLEDTEIRGRYDRIICLAVMEHCYDPFAAARNLFYMLKEGGTLYGYVPWLFRYHAPDKLNFQDYMRFSRDSLAYIFRDASELTLYPMHGPLTAALHQVIPAKLSKKLDERPKLAAWLDRQISNPQWAQQCSGYAFVARKQGA